MGVLEEIAGLYCSHCGVKNELNSPKCFICEKIMVMSAEEKADRTPRRSRPTPQLENLGSVGDRMLALIFDRLLIAALLMVPVAAFADYLGGNTVWIVAGGLIAALLIFGYHMFFEAAFGATLGKAIFGLRVRPDAGSRNTFRLSAIRNAFRLADGLAFYAPAFFSAFFSSRKQRIGDHVAHAVVVEERIHWAARGGWLLLWVITVVAAVAFASYLRPEARFDGLLTSVRAVR
jgi:uncharacterized RDD family membrane protein YckC